MRFLHGSASEREARERLLALADEALASLALDLGRGEPPGRAARELFARIAGPLEVELFEERDGSRTVVVSPQGERRLRPLTEAIIERAPKLPGVRFVSHRPPRPLGEALDAVKRSHGHDLTAGRARAGFSRGHLLDVVVYAPGFAGVRSEARQSAAELALVGLLGERLVDDWLGDIDAEPAAGGGPLRVLNTETAPTFPLAELPAAVSRAVEGLRAGLPELPCAGISRDGWVLFEVEPDAAMDPPAQDDVALASSALPEMLKCFLEGSPFSSLRFVQGSERFAYLKIDCHHLSFESRIGERTHLEDRLAERLAEQSLGAVVGNGLGLRYLYVDVALAPGRKSVDLVCEIARAASVAKRSWLLFFDTDLADEWVGVWPETPPPPGFDAGDGSRD